MEFGNLWVRFKSTMVSKGKALVLPSCCFKPITQKETLGCLEPSVIAPHNYSTVPERFFSIKFFICHQEQVCAECFPL